MKYAITSVLLLAALVPLARANPVFATIVNEFGFDGQGLGWVELHVEPLPDEVAMTNWRLVTSTSCCTLDCTIPRGGFLVVDSASLAGGGYGRGTFRLNPDGDSIHLLPDSLNSTFNDRVVFPALPVMRGQSPTPPALGSAALLNLNGAEQLITWYIDSTPTPEADNDNYSTMTGTVTWASNWNFYLVALGISGPTGGSSSTVTGRGQAYSAPGLSAGRYEVAAIGFPGSVAITYPESVDVGYSETRGGIDLDFGPYGVQEGFQPRYQCPDPATTVVRTLPRGAVAFDAMGRRVANPRPGVYFLREAQAQAQAVRKVVIAR